MPISVDLRSLIPPIFLLAGCPDDQAADVYPLQTSSSSSGSSQATDEPVPTSGADPMPVTSNAETDTTDMTDTGAPMEDLSTGTDMPVCGDGVVAGDEECDDTFAKNTLDGACLPGCVKASCGDGEVHIGVEECDFGAVNNNYEYGGCIPTTCKWGPRCGDGDVDAPNEVCDPGEPDGGDETVACDLDCRFAGRIVFLTSVAYNGNLGGLPGADSLCRDLAATFDTTRADSYIAWLSDAKVSPLDRIAHGPEFDGTPYVLRSGVEVAANFADLIDDGPWPGIDLTEAYTTITDVPVWTNTAIDGSVFSDEHHCDGWGSASGSFGARVGRNTVPVDSPELADWQKLGHWTSWTSHLCKDARHLYCFEN